MTTTTACNQEFHMLAVLSGTEQLTSAEQAILNAHVQSCTRCQQTLSEIAGLAPHLNLATSARPQLPRGHEARFIARATREGLPLRAPARALPTYALQLASIAALLVCAVSWSWTTRSPIEPTPQLRKAPLHGLTVAVATEPTLPHAIAHPVRNAKPAALHHPVLLSSSFRFAWPQLATTGAGSQPVFSRDLRHEDVLVTKPTFVSQKIGFQPLVQPSSFPFKVDMASLIPQEPPTLHLGEVAISDLTFIPNISSHP
ncbi:hypothetical protein SAMN05421771_2928 [Granulicella pectinivorans]|uniref:Zinc-finger n=1 Tax=Granulicella pectinivorans TaxID=474950 RepID=A0A1I6MLK0_9BACT|nr:hypothetical protein [Granulicella pectinivorans]SFS16529.1 hypothetical protein SAMN05421771_2928 [Granulicella pectinivorans]